MNNNRTHYMSITEKDKKFGVTCTTVEYQKVELNSKYPVDIHPPKYNFTKIMGRVLNEYQLVYIIEGEGLFESKYCPLTKIKKGTLILLFPNE